MKRQAQRFPCRVGTGEARTVVDGRYADAGVLEVPGLRRGRRRSRGAADEGSATRGAQGLTFERPCRRRLRWRRPRGAIRRRCGTGGDGDAGGGSIDGWSCCGPSGLYRAVPLRTEAPA